MTQLDLPQISLARYLDLLKRRRWQVVPVSLLGLVVGAVVAFFVPRYYVAETEVEFRGALLEPAGESDPMLPLVESAHTTIRHGALEKALRKVGWPEALAGTDEQRRAYEEAVRQRVEVQDLNPRNGRKIARIKIKYRDTDGPRAKELADVLRDLWIEQQQKLLSDAIDQKLADVNTRLGTADKTLTLALAEIAAYETAHGINPQDFAGSRDGVLSARTKELQDVEGKLVALEGQRAALDARLAAKRELLGKTPPKKEMPSELVISDELAKAYQAAQLDVAYATAVLAQTTESHPNRAMNQQRLALALEKLQALEKVVGVKGTVEVDNDDWVQLRRGVEDLAAERAGLERELERHGERAATLHESLRTLPDVHRHYRGFLDQRDRAQRELEATSAERRDLEARKRQLTVTLPYEVTQWAHVPPRPTEPNPTLLALAGSAIGLALAIGLILLLDVLQSTFKTIDDVERGLAVPVLGGISHMITDDQRRRLQVRRTRTGLVAGLFALLMVSLVTIYYVAPTRLPPMVRDTLDLLLGTPATPGAPR